MLILRRTWFRAAAARAFLLLLAMALVACSGRPSPGSQPPLSLGLRASQVTEPINLTPESRSTPVFAQQSVQRTQATTATPETAPLQATSPDASRSPQEARAAAVVPVPEAASPTTVIDYVPQKPDGQARAGTCRSSSLTVPSRGAWRCTVGKETLDPCFTVGDGQHVVCEPDPLAGHPGIPVHLSEPLPQSDLLAERANPIWLLQLPDDTICRLAPGVTGVVADRRITYLCGEARSDTDVVILGEPRSGTVWLADKVELALRNAGLRQEGQYAVKSPVIVPLRAVVRGPLLYVPAACEGVADAAAQMLGADFSRSEAPFTDPLTGQTGRGCKASASVLGSLLRPPPEEILPKVLAGQGWREEMRYRNSEMRRSPVTVGGFAGSADTGSAFREVPPGGLWLRGFTRADVLCLMNLSWEPVAGSSCSACQFNEVRGFAQAAKPELHLYTVDLNCGRDISLAGAPEPARRPPERINFAAGATAASLRRSIATGQIQEYVLRALAGQTMILAATSPKPDVFLSVYSSDGASLLHPAANARRWLGKLPATQDYVVRVADRGETTDFALDVIIPVDLRLPPEGGPMTVKGIVEPNETMYYLLPATVGQKLTLTITSPDRNVFLGVVGAEDGEPLVAPAKGLTTWTGILPRDGKYLLQAASTGVRVEYTLEMSVPGAS